MTTITKNTTITLAEAANITGFTKAWLLKLADQGYFAKEARGTYKLADVVRGVVAHLQSVKKAATQTAALARIQNAKAIEIEMRNARAIGQTADLDEVLQIFDMMLMQFRNRIEGLGAEVTRDRELRRKIDKVVDDALRTLAGNMKQSGEDWRKNRPAAIGEFPDDEE